MMRFNQKRVLSAEAKAQVLALVSDILDNPEALALIQDAYYQPAITNVETADTVLQQIYQVQTLCKFATNPLLKEIISALEQVYKQAEKYDALSKRKSA